MYSAILQNSIVILLELLSELQCFPIFLIMLCYIIHTMPVDDGKLATTLSRASDDARRRILERAEQIRTARLLSANEAEEMFCGLSRGVLELEDRSAYVSRVSLDSCRFAQFEAAGMFIVTVMQPAGVRQWRAYAVHGSLEQWNGEVMNEEGSGTPCSPVHYVAMAARLSDSKYCLSGSQKCSTATMAPSACLIVKKTLMVQTIHI
eukprot:scpid95540/ scgid14879/ 